MIPRLGASYPIEIDVTSKPIADYQTDEYFELDLPESVQATYCGVGIPFSLGAIDTGMAVIDIGSGAGVDTLVASLMVGIGGKAVDIDVTPEMVAKAEQ
jgi:hypothetical protein